MSSQTTPSPATLSVGKTASADPRPYTAPGKRAYVKPELIILDGDRSEGASGSVKGTKDDKMRHNTEKITPTSGDHYGPS